MTEPNAPKKDDYAESDDSEIEVYVEAKAKSDVNKIIKHVEKYDSVTVKLNVESGDDLRHIEPLAGVPQMCGLKLNGYHKCGTLAPFLKQAALTKFLKNLHIESSLNSEELTELNRVSSLTELTFGFKNCPEIDLTELSDLENMEKLNITGQLNAQIVAQVTSVVKKLKRNKRFKVRYNYDCIHFRVSPVRFELFLKSNEPVDLSVLAPAAELLGNTMFFTMEGNHMIGTLEALFKIVSDSGTSIHLREIQIRNWIPLTDGEAVAIFSIRSLHTLECDFNGPLELQIDPHQIKELSIKNNPRVGSLKPLFTALAKENATLQFFVLTRGILDISESCELARIMSLRYVSINCWNMTSLENLSQLANLDCCFINIKQAEPEMKLQAINLRKLLGASRLEAHVTYIRSIISYYPLEGSLKITFKKEVDVSLCSQLGTLGNLKSVDIRGRPTRGNLEKFLYSIANLNKLRELKLEKPNPEEILFVTEMKSLTSLQISAQEEKYFNLLTLLTHLKKLTIVKHPEGALTELLQGLADRKPRSELEYIVVKGCSLVPMELFHVARIRSLRFLRCSLKDTEDSQSLRKVASISCIEELSIHSYESGSMVNVFNALQQLRQLRCLVVTGRPLNTEEVHAAKKILTLKVLHCKFINASDISLLAQLPELEVLHVANVINRNSNAFSCFASHKPPLKILRYMINIGETDLKAIPSLTKLESLICVIGISNGINHLASLNLTELIIQVSKSLSLYPLFKALAKREPQILTKFVVWNQEIPFKQAQLLGYMKALTKLNMGFTESECFEYIPQLVGLEQLIIRTDNFEGYQIIQILENCLKLKEIYFLCSNPRLNNEFILEVIDHLRFVRNPQEQKPLKMFFHDLKYMSLHEVFIQK